MPSSRRSGKYVTRSEISARASRRALAFGSLARNGLIGARAGVAPGVPGVAPGTAPVGRDTPGDAGAAGGVGAIPDGRINGAVGRGALGVAAGRGGALNGGRGGANGAPGAPG